MEKKSKCEIVQDLLIGYVDDVLNEASKKLVEEHLGECEICQKRLEELKADIVENKQSQEREIDYLKKIRKKSKIKAILMAIGILMAIFVVWYVRQFIVVQSIASKAEQFLHSNNFYKETRQILTDNKVSVEKTYYKDGKCKNVWEIYSDEGKEINYIKYSTKDAEENITIIPSENKVNIETGEFVKVMNQEGNLKNASYPHNGGITSVIAKLGTVFRMAIHTDTRQIGREYYVVTNRFEKDKMWETWIDKDTGLTLKTINRNSVRNYIAGTDIVKEERDLVQEYQYKFDVVTDEDVEVPDLSNYEKEYVDVDANMGDG